MQKVIILDALILSFNISYASWWTFDSLNWNKVGIPHTLHLVSQIAESGIQIKAISQHHSANDDSLFVKCVFTDCGGFQSFYTWDSTIQLQPTADLLNYHLVLYIGYDSNTVNPNCEPHLAPILDTIYLGNSGVTGIKEVSSINDLMLFPNPVTGALIIKLHNNQAPENVKIYNMYGSLIKRIQKANMIDVSSLSAGIYYIEIKTNDNWLHSRFLKE